MLERKQTPGCGDNGLIQYICKYFLLKIISTLLLN